MVVKQPFPDRPVYVVRSHFGKERVLHRTQLKHCPWLPERCVDQSNQLTEDETESQSQTSVGYALRYRRFLFYKVQPRLIDELIYKCILNGDYCYELFFFDIFNSIYTYYMFRNDMCKTMSHQGTMTFKAGKNARGVICCRPSVNRDLDG